jgi:hypothetical protein
MKRGGLCRTLDQARALHREAQLMTASMYQPYLEGFAPAKERKVKNAMDASFGIGSTVIYVDSLGRERNAIVTNCFGPLESKPSINVVVVNDDENQTDTYGRKIERFSSVVHEANQFAHGNYWKPISE